MSRVQAADPMRPPLKWAGGKRWLVPHLRALWQPFQARRLVEPFCGGLSVTLGLRPDRALLNDVNPHTINFYRWLAKGLRSRIPMRNESELYYRHREDFNERIRSGRRDTRTAAELFYYLNRTGFNGLCRFNSKGLFNVPFGRYETINYRRDFQPFKAPLSAWELVHGDFCELSIERGDFVYADPPYDVPFTSYSADGFSWQDQVRLAQWLSRHAGPVVLSNQATPRIRELYAGHGFSLYYLKAPRTIACNGNRTPAIEVIALKGFGKRVRSEALAAVTDPEQLA